MLAPLAVANAGWAQPGPEALRQSGDVAFFGSDAAAPDPVVGCQLYQRAGELGDAAGAHAFASCAYAGIGMARDDVLAARWYGEAMRLGSVKSQCALGNMLIQGRGQPADPLQGLALCRSAAGAGDADAQADLGAYYLLGGVVDQDLTQAAQWLQRAADQGHPMAAYHYATMMWNGDAPGGRVASAGYWRIAVLGGRADAAEPLGDALLLALVAGAPNVAAVDWDVFDAARAAYQLAADDHPDPEARARARERLVQLDALARAAGRGP